MVELIEGELFDAGLWSTYAVSLSKCSILRLSFTPRPINPSSSGVMTMAHLDPAVLRTVVENVLEPSLQRPLGELNAVHAVTLEGDQVAVSIDLGYPAEGVAQALATAIHHAVSRIDGVSKLSVDVDWVIPASPAANAQQAIPGVKNIIAVASGKGGVGKSTTSVNLALALAAEGAQVGILDADIYGPSQHHMLGVGERRPQIVGEGKAQMMVPIEAHGIQSISMGYLVTEQTPMVWRGPMVSGALQQLLMQTRWNDLDYLIIDMPPGTGDIQITLAQRVPVTGAVIVTTPQDIALLDAKKGIEMFRKVSVPVLGVVENMAMHICSQCGHAEHIFGAGGGERIATEYQTALLGSLPLDLSIRELTDSGTPSVAADPDSPIAKAYREIARKLAAQLWLLNLSASPVPEIVVSED
ncbi:MAG: iron-sulfur cluster carrier protein ApbC [Cellvibrio sp.]|jgi:ATP-binding protein involved in chromosome partitioning